MRPIRSAVVALAALAVVVTVAPGAAGGVRVAETIDLMQAATTGAVGLAVPGAGPTVTRESALNTLLTGTVESSLLGGTPTGTPLIELDGSRPTEEIRVTLPGTGRRRNDTRYPVAVVGGGAAGVLTSDSTRITGLVSLADVATGRLRWIRDDDPVGTLATLESRIDRNARIRMPLTLALVIAAGLVGLLAPRWAPRLVLVALAANLWLAGWWVVALAGLAALALPLGSACAALVAAYLVTLGLDAEAVALSPFGPSQAGRFYGVSNLLATWLLLPALLGVAALRRWGIALAAAALLAVGGNRFGADGGGLLVLLAGYGTLAARLGGVRLTPARLAGLGAIVLATALALVGLDAALGGSSHVTAALGDGPRAVLGDVVDRLELSVRRAASGLAPLSTAIGLTALAVIATRRPRTPVTDAVLVAVVVSLLVNDTPTDVAAAGATVAFLVHRFETRFPFAHPIDLDRLRAMRRSTIVASSLLAVIALALAGCTGGEESSATPETVVGEIPTQAEPSTGDLPALELTGNPTDGTSVWEANGCGACHTLAAAQSSGTVGPNLDDAKPSYELAVQRVSLGQGGMPNFGDKLEPQQIADVAQFIVESTSG